MKLAEALLLRSDVQKKLLSLQSRAQKSATVQEGEKPAEDPNDLLEQIEEVAAELERLIFAINRANLSNQVRGEITITEALARRDCLIRLHSIVQSVIEASSRPAERYGKSEIRWVSIVDVRKLQSRVDGLAKEIRELNASIQEAGWQIELPN